MNKKLLAYLQYIFFIGLAAFFVWLSLRKIDADSWQKLIAALKQARFWIFFPVLILLLLSHWLRAVRWKMLIQPLGYNPSVLNVFFGVMVGYLVNLGAPRVGEIVKCTVLARYEKVPADKLVGTIVAERAFDLLCLVIVIGATIAIEFDTIGTFAMDSLGKVFKSKSGQFSVTRIVIIVGGLLVLIFGIRFVFKRFLHVNFISKFKVIMVGILHGLTSIKLVKNKWLFLFHTVSIWVLYLVSTWLGFKVLQQTNHLGLAEACAVLVMGSIGMIVSPGGIGAYPWFIEQTVDLYGVPADPYGTALGWLLWVGQFIIFVVFGALSFILLPAINRKKHATPSDHTTENIQA